MNTETQTCVHEPCLCMVESEIGTDGYCSEDCRAQDQNEEEENCPCGHPPCDAR